MVISIQTPKFYLLRQNAFNQQIQLMINRKISGLFSRKEAKRQDKPILYFDQNAFDCKIISKGINTDLIKIQTQIKDTGEPLDEIKCKWYIKNSKDFREIQDVNSTYYQPCLDDVGSTICVQIEPFIEGKKYNGITIMQQSQPLEIDNELEMKLDQFLETKYLKFDGRIENIFSQDQKYQSLELPLEVKIQIRCNSITILEGEKVLEKITISQDFPNIQFIRKSFSTILFNYNQKASLKLSLSNNFNRDLFALIVRTCAAHSVSESQKINPEQMSQKKEYPNNQELVTQNKQEANIVLTEIQQKVEQSQQQPIEQKDQSIKSRQKMSSTQSLEVNEKSQAEKVEKSEQKQSSTKFILKLDELNKELKVLKRTHEDLKLNYNIEKQAKLQMQKRIKELRQQFDHVKKERDEAFVIALKVRQLKQNNRFYKNEIMILKKQLKEQKQKVEQLDARLKATIKEKDNQLDSNNEMIKKQVEQLRMLKLQCERKIENSETEIQKYKSQFQKIHNQNNNLRKKYESLANQKGIIKNQLVQKKENVSTSSDQKVKQLQLKLKNLQMLLKYRNSQNQGGSNFQILVSKLTETLSDKELQIGQLKKINKNLLQQLKELKERTK